MLTGLKLLATAGLGGAYLWVAFLAAHPHVGAEYLAHFLAKTADCWLPQVLGVPDAATPAVVELRSIGYPEACRYLRLNWSPLEDWGAWAGARHASLHLPWKPGMAAVELTVRGVPDPGPSIHVQFSLNGQVTAKQILPGTSEAVIFALPPDPGRYTPHMDLDFNNYATVPGPSPGRAVHKISIGLVSIRYLPEMPATGK